MMLVKYESKTFTESSTILGGILSEPVACFIICISWVTFSYKTKPAPCLFHWCNNKINVNLIPQFHRHDILRKEFPYKCMHNEINY